MEGLRDDPNLIKAAKETSLQSISYLESSFFTAHGLMLIKGNEDPG